MAEIVGKIPEFTSNDSNVEEKGIEVVDENPQAPVDEAGEEEKDAPAELPAAEKPAQKSDDTELALKELETYKKANQGLEKEIIKLREERRKISSETPLIVPQVDELKDINPEDLKLVDRIIDARIKQRGVVTQQDRYSDIQNEELKRFLKDYPEYKPENDPTDQNWKSLQGMYGLYKVPSDPYMTYQLLEMAHKQIAKPVSDRNVVVKKQQAKIASVGGGGIQRSSSKPVNPKLSALIDQHLSGWSEEEIKDLKQNLPE